VQIIYFQITLGYFKDSSNTEVGQKLYYLVDCVILYPFTITNITSFILVELYLSRKIEAFSR
jgi:hypothetical protein